MIAAAPTGADVTVRPARPDDQAFVAATFAEQLARGGHKDGNQLADRVLDSDSIRVLVACASAGKIVGWLAYAAIPRVRAVLFIYVRNKHRLGGIAKQLTDAAWPRPSTWVHGGLRGASTRGLLGKFNATQVALEELL